MIRKFVFLRRHAKLDEAAFHAACAGRHVGGDLDDPAFRENTQEFILNVVQPQVPGLMPEPIWDVVEESLLDPARSDRAALRDDHNLAVLPPHADPDQIVQFMALERIVLDGPARGVRIFSLPRRRAGMSPDSFSRHYRETHGALVARNEAFVTHCNRYVQHHVLPETVRATGGFAPYDGISEFWFDSLDKARAAWDAPSYMAELRADEKNFVGSPPSHRILVRPTSCTVR